MNWIVLFLIISCIWKKRWIGRWSFRLGIIGLILFSNPLLINLATRAWETEPVLIEDLKEPHDIGIVLGGFSRVVEEYPDRLHLNSHPNRLIHAIQLYQAGKIKKIFIVGGSPAIIGSKRSDTPDIKEFLVRSGIPESDVMIESESRNTWENAKFCAEILSEQAPDSSYMLITSASHIPRATACFAKAGVTVTPFATDQTENEIQHLTPNSLLMPKASAFSQWNSLIKEWVGMVVYKIRGYA